MNEPKTVSDQPAYTIPQFCEHHGIGRGLFYKLRARGEAPLVVKVGRRSIITGEAAAQWRAQVMQRAQQGR